MLFPTVAFALFFCVAFLANWLLRPRPTAWRVAMVGLSFYFYGYWDARFTVLLAAAIAVNHVVAITVAPRRTPEGLTPLGRWVLGLGIAADLGLLAAFKYYGFFATSVANGLDRVGLSTSAPVLEVALPIGISFFTFQAISYIIDVARGRIDEPMPLLSFAFYLSFFPQLVAGPIVRATQMAPQIDRRPDPRTIPAGEAFWLIGQGLIKKVVISSYLAANVVDPVFDFPTDRSRIEILLATYGYAIQIYADFSGYTDIAIGVALLLGFRFAPNFDAPYRSLSVREFWRRWHISLSTWLRDYLYVPLGGSRRGRLLTARNLAITMVLGGLWHGAAWTFVLWGAIHAGALIAERGARSVVRRWRPELRANPAFGALRWLVTFHVVCLGWIFFRADSVGHGLDLLGRLVEGSIPSPGELGDVADLSPAFLVAAAAIAAAVGLQWVPSTTIRRLQDAFGRTTPIAQVGVLALALTVIDALGPAGVDPFIYFQF